MCIADNLENFKELFADDESTHSNEKDAPMPVRKPRVCL